jgi:hypothetical protein
MNAVGINGPNRFTVLFKALGGSFKHVPGCGERGQWEGQERAE